METWTAPGHSPYDTQMMRRIVPDAIIPERDVVRNAGQLPETVDEMQTLIDHDRSMRLY